MHMPRILQISIVAIIAATAFYILKPASTQQAPQPAITPSHIIDKAGVIPTQDIPKFEQYMSWIMRESGVDMRFVFVPSTEGTSIETMAAKLLDQLQIGGRTGQERGVLLLYDMQGQQLKVEVGYGLEAYLPDAFVNYLAEDHARMFFSSGDISLGLRTMLRLLQQRIRDAVMGNDFDPRTLHKMQSLTHMSGGAGASKDVSIGDDAEPPPDDNPPDPMDYPAGDTPKDAYYVYLDWLSNWPLSSQVDLFTPESRSYLKALRISPAYAEFILMAEYGKRFEIVERGDVALLYFTGTPFVSPHFFVRENEHWRMDIAAEVRDTHEHVGGEYTWAYSGKDDKYTQNFNDLLINIKGYTRIRNGDNRELTISGSY